MALITLKNVNEHNRRFWTERRRLFTERMADVVIWQNACELLKAEENRRVPEHFRTPVYDALELAARGRARVLAERGRKGGKARRVDPLQLLIEEFVEADPRLSSKELKEKLKAHDRIDPIQDFTQKKISFTARDGRLKEAPLTGLKDRLSRAKKKNRSRKPVGAN